MQWIVKQTKSKGYEFTFDIVKGKAVIGQAHYIPKLLRQGYGIRLNDSKFLLQYMPAADARAYMRGINTKDILETIKMIEEEHLDIRTITMGISLRDLAADDINVLADKVYDKVTRRAEKLVATGEQIERELGIPIINKRISVTPIAMVGATSSANSYVPLAKALDRAAETGTLPDMPLYRVTEALETDGTAILPSLSLDRFGQTAPSGTAVFTEGKLSCFLDGGMIGGERFA